MTDLSENERLRIANNKAVILESLPELVPLIRSLVAVGLIEGWRNVEYAGPVRPEPEGPHVFSGADLQTESMTTVKERMARTEQTHAAAGYCKYVDRAD